MKRILIALLASLIVVSAVPAQTPPPPADKKAETKEPDKAEKKDEKKEEKKWDVDNPPGPHYDVPIDVTEGTWLSLDVSPDGNEIAFDLLGDIYTIPMTGGEAKSLTSGVAWDMQPRYSPNGKWIAFTSDRAGARRGHAAVAESDHGRGAGGEERRQEVGREQPAGAASRRSD